MSSIGQHSNDKKVSTHAVVKFQALWRGYIYKMAYPIALAQSKEQIAQWEWENEGEYDF